MIGKRDRGMGRVMIPYLRRAGKHFCIYFICTYSFHVLYISILTGRQLLYNALSNSSVYVQPQAQLVCLFRQPLTLLTLRANMPQLKPPRQR